MRRRIVLGSLLAMLCLALTLAVGQAPRANSEDEQAIRKSAEAYSAAYNRGDLDGIMTHWAADADYMDETGKVTKGRDAIAALFKKGMAKNKGSKLKIQVGAVRFVRPEVALEDGKVEMTSADGGMESSRYTAVWVKAAGKWLLTSVRDLPDETESAATTPYGRLKELEWLVGDWSTEEKNVSVHLAARWALNKSYILVDFTVKGKDGGDMSVAQWYGWDPVNGRIRSWFFDSRGGFGESFFTRKGNSWTAEVVGHVADGRRGTATNTIKFVDDKTFLFQSTDREVDGEPLADNDAKFVRKSATP